FGFGSLDGREHVSNLRSKLGAIGKRIDQSELSGVIEEGLLLMLTVNVQKQGRQFAQRGNSARLIVDVNAVSLVRRDFATDDDFISLGIQAELVEFALNIPIENRFDNRAGLSGPHHFGRSLGTRKQAESVHDHGFSGACLTRKEIETVAEVKFDLIDES